MGTWSQIKASLSRPQKKSFKLKVDQMKTCKCKQRGACLSSRVSGVELVKERYCTTLCHRSTALAAPLLVAGTCVQRQRRKRTVDIQLESQQRRAGVAGRVEGQENTGCYRTSRCSATRFNKPSVPGRGSSLDRCDSFRGHPPSRSYLAQRLLQTIQISERQAAGRLERHFIFI